MLVRITNIDHARQCRDLTDEILESPLTHTNYSVLNDWHVCDRCNNSMMATVCDHRLDPDDYGIQECRLFVEPKIRSPDKVEINTNKAIRNAHRTENWTTNSGNEPLTNANYGLNLLMLCEKFNFTHDNCNLAVIQFRLSAKLLANWTIKIYWIYTNNYEFPNSLKVTSPKYSFSTIKLTIIIIIIYSIKIPGKSKCELFQFLSNYNFFRSLCQN